MAVKGQLVNGQLVRFSGLDSRVPRSKWRTWLTDVAEDWIEQIAENYADEKAAGRALKANTEKYDDWKAEAGKDLRRGHLDGVTQDALDEGKLFRVSAVQGNETATVELLESRLFAKVPWAEYYQEQKVVGGKLLTVLKSMVHEAEDFLNDRLVEVLGKDAMKKIRRGVQKANARLVFEQKRASGARAVRIRVA